MYGDGIFQVTQAFVEFLFFFLNFDKSSAGIIAYILIDIYDQVTDLNTVFMKIFANLLSFSQFAYCF